MTETKGHRQRWAETETGREMERDDRNMRPRQRHRERK